MTQLTKYQELASILVTDQDQHNYSKNVACRYHTDINFKPSLNPPNFPLIEIKLWSAVNVRREQDGTFPFLTITTAPDTEDYDSFTSQPGKPLFDPDQIGT